MQKVRPQKLSGVPTLKQNYPQRNIADSAEEGKNHTIPFAITSNTGKNGFIRQTQAGQKCLTGVALRIRSGCSN